MNPEVVQDLVAVARDAQILLQVVHDNCKDRLPLLIALEMESLRLSAMIALERAAQMTIFAAYQPGGIADDYRPTHQASQGAADANAKAVSSHPQIFPGAEVHAEGMSDDKR